MAAAGAESVHTLLAGAMRSAKNATIDLSRTIANEL
jgi:hypothetical protein